MKTTTTETFDKDGKVVKRITVTEDAPQTFPYMPTTPVIPPTLLPYYEPEPGRYAPIITCTIPNTTYTTPNIC